MELILGSTSPRRKEILEFFSYPFKVASSHFDEDSINFDGDPKVFASKLSLGKANSLKPKYPNSMILTADTVVFINGQSLGKPTSDEEAFSMLSTLSGKWHSVFTALTLATPTIQETMVEETKVLCNELSPDDIKKYIRAHSTHDKAGSYAIQESGYLLINQIVGCYYNVMGLPINTLRKILFLGGVNLWDYLKILD